MTLIPSVFSLIGRLLFILLLAFLIIIITGIRPGTPRYTVSEDKRHAIDSIINEIDSVISINLKFAGDVMVHRRQLNSAYNRKTGKYDFSDNYIFLKELLNTADLAFVNLETPLVCEAPYSGYPAFRNPSEIAEALKFSGFNVILTANNHSNDAGGKVLKNTIDVIKSHNMYQTGTFRNQQERDSLYPLIIVKSGFKIAVLNYTYGTNEIENDPPTITNIIDTAQIRQDVEKAELLKPDIMIAYLHWGKEYELFENEYQREHAEFLANLGIDLIVGSHPHVIQPVQWIKRHDGDSVLCAYSLGNLISNQRFENTDGGMLLEVIYRKNILSGEIHLAEFYHHLTWVSITHPNSKHPSGKYYVIPISLFEQDMISFPEISEYGITMMSEFADNMRLHLKETSVSNERGK